MKTQYDGDALALISPILQDAEVTEVMIDGYQKVYIEKRGVLQDVPSPFANEAQLLQLIRQILEPMGREANESNCLVDARLSDGSYANVVMPPIALNGPVVTLRKLLRNRMTSADLVRLGSASEAMLNFLRACIEARLNILVAGGTASGKNTLLGILAQNIPDEEHLVLLQHADEVILEKPRLVKLETRPPNLEGRGEVSMQALAKNAVMMRPDRILTLDVSGGEALVLMQAMNSGHDGTMQSLHADDPRDALERWERMVSYANPSLPLLAIRHQMATAFDLVIYAERLSDGSRKIMVIAEVTGFADGVVMIQDIFHFQRQGKGTAQVQGFFTATGIIPNFLPRMTEAGLQLPVSLFTPVKA